MIKIKCAYQLPLVYHRISPQTHSCCVQLLGTHLTRVLWQMWNGISYFVRNKLRIFSFHTGSASFTRKDGRFAENQVKSFLEGLFTKQKELGASNVFYTSVWVGFLTHFNSSRSRAETSAANTTPPFRAAALTWCWKGKALSLL